VQPRATDSGLRAPATPLRAAPPAAGPRQAGESPRQGRKPFRDNPTLLLAGIALLVGAFVALIVLARRTTSFSPDFLTEVVLYALSVADLTMLVALVFVLARNIIKLVVERRRALPFARFRAKLVAVLLGLTLVPSILVLLVGSELIRNSADRWFNAPMDEILSSANRIASDYYAERQRSVVAQSARIARQVTEVNLASADTASLQAQIASVVSWDQVKLVEVFRVASGRHRASWCPCWPWCHRRCLRVPRALRPNAWPAASPPERRKPGCSSRSPPEASCCAARRSSRGPTGGSRVSWWPATT